MKYEKMTVEEFEALFLETELGIFTPKYEYEEFDNKKQEYINLEIIKTAQEMYEDFLNRKPVEPSDPTHDKLEKIIADLEIDILNKE